MNQNANPGRNAASRCLLSRHRVRNPSVRQQAICATGIVLSTIFIDLNMDLRAVTAAITQRIYGRWLRAKYSKHIDSLRARYRGVRLRSTVWWLLVALIGFGEVSFLYTTFSKSPDRSTSSHFYGLTTEHFTSMEQSRLVFLTDYSFFFSFDFHKLWIVVCIYWELVFVGIRGTSTG